MQHLEVSIIKQAKAEKIKNLEEEMKEVVIGNKGGNLFECPFCHYESKKTKRGSAIVFKDQGRDIFFCFACRKWRRI